MSLTDQTHEPFSPFGFFNEIVRVISPELLGELIRKHINGPAEELEKLSCAVETAIAARISALRTLPVADLSAPEAWTRGSSETMAERARLRSLRGLLPLLGTQALTYLLGMLRLDGRPGDYAAPDEVNHVPGSFRAPSCCGPECGPAAKKPTEEERVVLEVRYALTGADAFADEVATVWVARPAVESAVHEIKLQRGRDVSVTRQPDHVVDLSGDPWAVRDLLVVQPVAAPLDPQDDEHTV